MSTDAKPEDFLARANALLQSGRLPDADSVFRALIAKYPDFAEGPHHYGLMLARHGRGDAARTELERATQLAPGRSDIRVNYATVCQHLGDLATALIQFETARDQGARLPELFYNLGVVYQGLERYSEAAASLAEANALSPGWPEPWLTRSSCLLVAGQAAAAADVLARGRATHPAADAFLASNHLMALNYVDSVTPEELSQQHRTWGDAAIAAAAAGGSPSPRSAGARPKRLRLGFVSPNLSEHSVAFFLEPLLANLSRSRFESIAYTVGRSADTVTSRLKARFDRWREVGEVDDKGIARAIVADRIDVLIDLAGHTANNRLPLFARRIAPVQLSMIGYPATTGLASVDYCISDGTLDPVDEGGAAYVERLGRLPLFCCYRPPDPPIDPGPLPMLANGVPTFGCFQSLAKLTPATLAVWSELFRRFPTARLVIKALGGKDPVACAALRERLAAAGMPASQVRIEGFSGFADFLRAHHEIDLFLDTLLWNGHTTTCHALWMGVPTLTLAGDRRAGRMGKALMQAVGMPQFVAGSAGEFAGLGEAALSAPGSLAELRAGLRRRLLESPLCDGKDFAQHFERFLEDAFAAAAGAQPA
jgi:protein O-GlcNAc transferase